MEELRCLFWMPKAANLCPSHTNCDHNSCSPDMRRLLKNPRGMSVWRTGDKKWLIIGEMSKKGLRRI